MIVLIAIILIGILAIYGAIDVWKQTKDL